MKRLFSLFILITLFSCREYRALMSEHSKFITEKKLNFIDEKMEAFNVSINGINHCLFFDTGAGVTLINNAKFNLKEDKIIRQKKIYGFDKKTVSTSTTYSVDSVTTDMFTTKNKYLYVSNIENIKSCSVEKYDGILGNFFSEIENEIELNFEKGFVRILENSIDKSNYIPLESKFNSISGKFYVKINVNGINDFFLFDTGNKTGIYLNKEVYKTLPDKVIAFSTINSAVNNTLLKTKFDIYQTTFKLADNLIFSQYVAIDETSKRSVLNQQFIKKFNWIIDKNHNVVYCKPIAVENLNSSYKIPSRNELVNVINNAIIIIFSIEGKSKYQIGDEIISVNNEKVTPENICEMQEILTKTDDWETLKIEVRSQTKPQS